MCSVPEPKVTRGYCVILAQLFSTVLIFYYVYVVLFTYVANMSNL